MGANRPSLGREFFEQRIQPLLDRQTISIKNQLATLTESAAEQIATAIRNSNVKKPTVLCTGGGAFNAFLLFRIMEHGGDDFSLVVPDDDVIKFKEALVFAFLGVLRVRDEINCLKSVTGATRDSSSGVMVGF
jgi:anhydro-N-acetylmuramic acid kinase